MSFVVDDLLDYAQLNAGKFRQEIKEFDLKEAVDEIISIQDDKAKLGGITLKAIFKPLQLMNSSFETEFELKLQKVA